MWASSWSALSGAPSGVGRAGGRGREEGSRNGRERGAGCARLHTQMHSGPPRRGSPDTRANKARVRVEKHGHFPPGGSLRRREGGKGVRDAVGDRRKKEHTHTHTSRGAPRALHLKRNSECLPVPLLLPLLFVTLCACVCVRARARLCCAAARTHTHTHGGGPGGPIHTHARHQPPPSSSHGPSGTGLHAGPGLCRGPAWRVFRDGRTRHGVSCERALRACDWSVRACGSLGP